MAWFNELKGKGKTNKMYIIKKYLNWKGGSQRAQTYQ